MEEKRTYDLVVIGAGPGGYVACVRAAQLGMKVACVECNERMGGVCLNVGCIPSKALLDSSERYRHGRQGLADHGVIVDSVRLDLAAMMARKDRVVERLTADVRRLLEQHRVDIVRGSGRLVAPNQVAVETAGPGDDPPGAEIVLEAGSILLASGSESIDIPGVVRDGERIVGSTEALAFAEVPGRLGIIGGGAIGLELGSVWNRLGSRVTVIEMLPRIAALLDGQLSRTLLRLLRAQGFSVLLETRVVSVEAGQGAVVVGVEAKGEERSLIFDRLLVAVGRRPHTRGLGLEEAGVALDPATGQVTVDARYRTSVDSVYAIGDLIAGPMLAHKASAEALACVEGIAGHGAEVNYDAIPAIVYTSPEAASVGKTEEELRALEIPYCSGVYPFRGAGRAQCAGETDGFVKVLNHARTDRILGVHMIGPRASDLIAEAVLAMEMGASAEDVARTVHGHPSFSEVFQEAARSASRSARYGDL